VRLEPLEDVEQLLLDLREVLAQVVEVLGVADARHHVLALRVDQEVAVGHVLAGGGVAGEAHAGAGVLVAVAEHHRLHVDRGAEVVADALAHAVGDGAGAVPAERTRPRPRRAAARAASAGTACRSPSSRRRGTAAQALQHLGRQLGVGLDAGLGLGGLERVLEDRAVEPSTMRPYMAMKRRYESYAKRSSSVTWARPFTLSSLSPRLRTVSIMPGIENLAPERTTRAAGRTGRRACGPSLLELEHLLGDLLVEPGRPAAVHVGAAGVGGDGEARGDRQLQHTRHLGEVGALATEEVLVLHRRAAVLVIEGIDVRHGQRV
jgi:hypothetical protein